MIIITPKDAVQGLHCSAGMSTLIIFRWTSCVGKTPARQPPPLPAGPPPTPVFILDHCDWDQITDARASYKDESGVVTPVLRCYY